MDLHSLCPYLARKGAVVLLESQSDTHPWSKKSYLAALPEAYITARNAEITIAEKGAPRTERGNPWSALKNFRKKHQDWLFGYMGYDLKNHLENLSSTNVDKVGAPDLFFMIPAFLAEFDHRTQKLKLLKGDLSELPGSWESEVKQETECRIETMRSGVTREQYLKIVRQAQHYITEGDCYEVNLSHQLRGEFRGQPWNLYQQMKQAGPVPFGSYLQLDELAVCCQSPERFLRKEGSTVISQPIKGTAQRGTEKNSDDYHKQQLRNSLKEQAENLMIVDLVRNDLSRIAEEGTVKVPSLFEIQSFETVHQMVSTVQAEARVSDPIEIIKACFPMGSMTGAPKISAMRIIEQLENYRRGIYSGTIGYISPTDNFDFNVVIRSAIVCEDEVFYSTGGAITSDSRPEKEWEETQLKAKALLDIGST